jgi:hypothetical protein
MHSLSEISIARSDLAEISNKNTGTRSPKETCTRYALNIFVYLFLYASERDFKRQRME